MSKKFAVFDIDGTLIRWQLYHNIVDQLAKQGDIPTKDHDKIKQARMTWKRRVHTDTFKDYEWTLVKVFHKNLPNISPASFEEAVNDVFEIHKDQVYTYTRNLIRDLKKKNYMLFAISGSHHEVVTKLGEHYGFDEVIGNTYERAGEKFTGNHQDVVSNKDKLLKGLISKYNLTKKDSIAVGDSRSDAGLLRNVENPIAFNPDSNLLKIATQKKWKIVVERKNVTYTLEYKNGTYQLNH